MQLTDRIALIELLWTIPALIAAGYAFYRARDARADAMIQTAVDPKDEPRSELAKSNARTANGIFWVLLLFVVAGVLSLIRVNPKPIPTGTYIVSGVLLLADFLMVRIVILDARVRKRLLSGAAELERLRIVQLKTQLEEQTAAIKENTAVTAALTHEIANGPLAASKLQTIALDRLSDSLDAQQDAEGA